jgi:sarcosine oxidase subunit beta
MSEHGDTTELLIIGGGVIGASIAYHCAEAGVQVTLVEKNDGFGQATTSETARAFRSYFPRRPYDSELVVRSMAEFRNFAKVTGTELELVDLGLLTILTNAQDAAEVESHVPAQRAAGVELELLTGAQAKELNPWLDPDTVELAVWTPQTYRLKPEVLVAGYADAARRLGARLLTGTTVTGIDASTGHVTTTAGDFTADAIVIAAGPLSGDVAKLAGLELPVWGQFSELLFTNALSDGEIRTPFTLHPISGLKTMGWGNGFLVGLERISKQAGMRDIWFQAAVDELPKWYPQLENLTLRSGWTGTLDVTPSKSAIIGRGAGEHERLLFAAGYTGHGLAQSPITGRLVRDLHLGREPEVDLTPYSLATNLVEQERDS